MACLPWLSLPLPVATISVYGDIRKQNEGFCRAMGRRIIRNMCDVISDFGTALRTFVEVISCHPGAERTIPVHLVTIQQFAMIKCVNTGDDLIVLLMLGRRGASCSPIRSCSAPVLFVSTDDHVIRYATRSAGLLLGISAQQLCGALAETALTPAVGLIISNCAKFDTQASYEARIAVRDTQTRQRRFVIVSCARPPSSSRGMIELHLRPDTCVGVTEARRRGLRYDICIDTLCDGAWFVEWSTRRVTVTRNYATFMDMQLEETPNTLSAWAAMGRPESQEVIEVDHANMLECAKQNKFIHYPLISKTGKTRWVTTIYRWREIDDALWIGGIVHDVTRMHSEIAELTRTIDLIREIDDVCGHATSVHSVTGSYRHLSPTFYRVFAIAPAGGSTAVPNLDEWMDDEARRRFHALQRNCIETGRPFSMDVLLTPPDHVCSAELSTPTATPTATVTSTAITSASAAMTSPSLSASTSQDSLLSGECRVRGRARWMQYNVSLKKDRNGDAEALLGVFIDITGRIEAEAELRMQSTCAAHETIPIAILQKGGELYFCNRAYERLFGYTCEELRGKSSCTALRGTRTTDDYASLLTVTTAATKVTARNFLYHRDGTEMLIEFDLSPLTNSRGEIDYLCAFARDVTLAERQQQELEDARRHAVESTRLKSEFLAMMSHEIRTPMNAVLGMTRVLLDMPLHFDQLALLNDIHNSGVTLLALINSILEFSKLEARKMVLDVHSFDLVQCLEQSVAAFSRDAARKGIELVCALSAELPTRVIGDSVKIQQITANLLSNAVRNTSAGGQVILMASSVLHCNAAATRNAFTLQLRVCDNGCGISLEDQQRLFAPFARLGAGLGLTITKLLTEMMSGSISVRSELNVGSTFTVRIPIAMDGLPQCSLPAAASGSQHHGVVCLRNPLQAMAFANAMLSFGANVVVCHSVPQLCALLLGTRLQSDTADTSHDNADEDAIRPLLLSDLQQQQQQQQPSSTDTISSESDIESDIGSGLESDDSDDFSDVEQQQSQQQHVSSAVDVERKSYGIVFADVDIMSQLTQDVSVCAVLGLPYNATSEHFAMEQEQLQQLSAAPSPPFVIVAETDDPRLPSLTAQSQLETLTKPLRRTSMLKAIARVTGCASASAQLSRSAAAAAAAAASTHINAIGVDGTIITQQPLRILLAEDNAINQRVASLFLARLGHHVKCVWNGEEAVQETLLNHNKYDVILMDVQMPVLDGLTATRQLRTVHGIGTPIVALTANATQGDRATCLMAGMDDYMSKPFEISTLRNVLARWSHGRMRGQQEQQHMPYS